MRAIASGLFIVAVLAPSLRGSTIGPAEGPPSLFPQTHRSGPGTGGADTLGQPAAHDGFSGLTVPDTRRAGCPGARRGVVHYRHRANGLRRLRGLRRYPVGLAHRSRKCGYVRFAAELWRGRARRELGRYRYELRLVAQLDGPGYPPPPLYLARVVVATWPPGTRQTATCLSYAESGYNTWRRVDGSSWSRTGDHAWWQINYVTWRSGGESEAAFHRRLSNVNESARVAHSISGGGRSWLPWTGTYGRGLCRGLR